MEPIRVGLVADPAAPTEIARHMTDLGPLDGSGGWDITVVSEPFTTGSEDVGAAVGRLQDRAREQDWDLVVGLTELPLHDHEGRHLLVETDVEQRIAVLWPRWQLEPWPRSTPRSGYWPARCRGGAWSSRRSPRSHSSSAGS
jgi:hypothetical protein